MQVTRVRSATNLVRDSKFRPLIVRIKNVLEEFDFRGYGRSDIVLIAFGLKSRNPEKEYKTPPVNCTPAHFMFMCSAVARENLRGSRKMAAGHACVVSL